MPRRRDSRCSEQPTSARPRRCGGSPAPCRRRRARDPAPPSDPPLLIAADQEGGQLMALGNGFTPFAGPMAIGATGDADLARSVGEAIGQELRAVGVNVDYAPVLDVAINPANPSLGIRSFGDDPAEVARLADGVARRPAGAGRRRDRQALPGFGRARCADTHSPARNRRSIAGRARLRRASAVPRRRSTQAFAWSCPVTSPCRR